MFYFQPIYLCSQSYFVDLLLNLELETETADHWSSMIALSMKFRGARNLVGSQPEQGYEDHALLSLEATSPLMQNDCVNAVQ